MKTLSEEAIEYIDAIWGFSHSDQSDDMAAFWDEGYFELVALRLVGAGAVERNCKEAKELIKVAHSIGPRIERRLIDEALQEYFIQECQRCNAVCFFLQGNEPGYCYSCAHEANGPVTAWTALGQKRGAK